MKLSKLKRVHVIIIGAVVCVLIGVGMFFLLIKPCNESLAQLQQRYDAAYPEAMEEPKARRDLDEAIRKVSEMQKKLDTYMVAKMPEVDFSDRTKGMVELWHEQCETLGPLLESYAKRTGVKVLNDRIPVPAPPVNPNDPSMLAGVIVLPLGSIQVQGSFNQVMKHIRDWNNCGRLVMIDLPTLSGQSPTLQAAYNLSVIIFPRGQVGPVVDMAGAGTGGAPGMAPMAPMMQNAPMPGAPQQAPMAPPAGDNSNLTPSGELREI